MPYNHFIERIEWGEEFLLKYHGEEYWISQNPQGYYLTRVKDGYSQNFDTAQNLFEKALIEDKTLLKIWSEISQQI